MKMKMVEKSGSTARFRKTLRTQMRAGVVPARIVGKTGPGFAIAAEVGESLRIVSDRFAKQWQAVRWATHKMGVKPRKMLAKAA